jgi:hypothetical protein
VNTLKNAESSSSWGLSSKTAPKELTDLSDRRSEISPERVESEKPYQKGIVALFKNTASEWIQDKCPQLGAALAYFTVFSLAPLVLVLLAVFGLIFGGSDINSGMRKGVPIAFNLRVDVLPKSGTKVQGR